MQQIVPVILILVGVLFLIIGFVGKIRANAASNWPTTLGAILKSEVVKHTTTVKTGEHRRTNIDLYEPVVEYQYTVNGKAYNGKRLAFGATRLPYEQAQEVSAKYPVGGQVLVYYNPNRAKDVRLDVSAKGAGPQLVIGIIIGVIGFVWLVITLL